MYYKKLTDYKLFQTDELYTSFVRDLYYAYAGNYKRLKIFIWLLRKVFMHGMDVMAES